MEEAGPTIGFEKKAKLTKKEIEGIERQVSAQMEEAVRFAKESPEPDVRTALEDIYA